MNKNRGKLSTNKFVLGQVVATISLLEAFRRSQADLGALFDRHVAGDFGDVTDEQRELNQSNITAYNENAKLEEGFECRVSSVYTVSGRRVWVITDLRTKTTTVMLPHEKSRDVMAA